MLQDRKLIVIRLSDQDYMLAGQCRSVRCVLLVVICCCCFAPSLLVWYNERILRSFVAVFWFLLVCFMFKTGSPV